MEVATSITTGIAKAIVKRIYGNIKASRKLEDTYFNFSVEARMKGRDKDSFLLVSEKENKYFMPIGGTMRSLEIINSLNKEAFISESNLKPRSLSDGELAFSYKKDKESFKSFFFRRGIKRLLNVVVSNISTELIIENIIREFKEETGILLREDDINKHIGISIETKRYLHGTERVHVYFVVDLKPSEELYKKIEEQGQEKLIFDRFRRSDKKSTISDLVMVFSNLIPLKTFRKK